MIIFLSRCSAGLISNICVIDWLGENLTGLAALVESVRSALLVS